MQAASVVPSVQESPVRARIQTAFHAIVKGHKEQRARNPVDQQYIAAYLSAEKRGKPVNHPAQAYFYGILHDSVRKLVLKVCQKYVVNSQSDIDDLSQDCYIRITRRIGTFNHRKGKFSTWCWKVCASTMNSGWRRQIRHPDHSIPVENIENFPDIEAPEGNNLTLINNIVQTIRYIARTYPGKRNILYAMFGDPDQPLFSIPERIRVSKVARDIGVPYGEAYAFYRDIVRKTFKRRMGATI